jgi:WD40 repeat protein
LAFSPDGRYVQSASYEKEVFWDQAEGKGVELPRRDIAWHMPGGAYSPDGKFALRVNDDQNAVLVELQSGKQIKSFKIQSEFVGAVALSPDMKHALVGGAPMV